MSNYAENSPLIDINGHRNSIFSLIYTFFNKKHFNYTERMISFDGKTVPSKFVPNIVCNQKYSLITFIPKVLFDQFSNFFNFFYLIVALLQLIPELRTGPLFTYIAPLLLVLSVTIGKEAIDDIKRYKRDREFNNKRYRKIIRNGTKEIRSCDIKVGDLIEINTNDRVPADILFLRTNDPTGTVFVRTDQLDGETDWKVKRAVGITQHSENLDEIFDPGIVANIEAPKKDIYVFNGTIQYHPQNNISSSENIVLEGSQKLFGKLKNHGNMETNASDIQVSAQPVVESLMLDNTIWANSVLTCGKIYGLVIYTGVESRSLMSTCTKSLNTKSGLLDSQVNTLSKILFVLLFITSFVLVFCKGFDTLWYISFARFMLLLSSIIPISLRVNLEMAKIVFSFQINNDNYMRNVTVRTSIPEELGRVDYLLTDKTGTLTQNYMVVQTLHIGHTVFHPENFCEIVDALQYIYKGRKYIDDEIGTQYVFNSKTQLSPIISDNAVVWNNSEYNLHLQNFILGIALCHNIFPRSSIDSKNHEMGSNELIDKLICDEYLGSDECMVDLNQKHIVYQSSSPDEIALINFAANLGLRLVGRSSECIDLDFESLSINKISNALDNSPFPLKRNDHTSNIKFTFKILACFPFCSSSKRMGILLEHKGKYIYFCKGAESVMIDLLRQRGSGWLLEECTNLARLGLRTLVFSYKIVSSEEYETFNEIFSFPCTSLLQREQNLNHSRKILENDMELLGLTGVEDKLQIDVPLTLEAFRYAGIKTWLLTGDKLETALCIAISAGLKPKNLNFFILGSNYSKKNLKIEKFQIEEIIDQLNLFINESASGNLLVVEGSTLSVCMKYCPFLLIHAATLSPAVIWCRCSPSQKKDLVLLLKEYHLKFSKVNGNEYALKIDEICSINNMELTIDEDVEETRKRVFQSKSGFMKRRAKDKKSLLTKYDDFHRNPTYLRESTGVFNDEINNINSLFGSIPSSALSSTENIDEWVNESNMTNRYTQNSIFVTNYPKESEYASDIYGIMRSCRICAVGDGGNDVGMIQAADIGIGIVGKEGQQAANAADISIHEFADLRPLFLWHGRHAYQNSAKLAYFVIHRGLIIASMQCIFSAIFYFIPVALFQGWLAVGYATYYTMAPVFSLVFDADVNRSTALLYPELYRHLKAGRVMSTKAFFCWVWKSLYQGTVIILGAVILFKDNILMNLVAITFTSLILSEILNVVTEIHHWNEVIISSCIVSLIIYFASFFLLKGHFDLQFIFTLTFWGKICVLTSISWGPILIYKLIKKTIHPPRYYKLMQH
ncbi:putative phospholipid-transporting ATPase IIB isoform X2 [Cryptosporidium felis]|nr:putative phospholipid-transporting ATPase IIB isoform X2 [Cryptosporidium felis]